MKLYFFQQHFLYAFFPFFLRWGNSHYEQRGDSLKVISISDVKVCSNTIEINLRYSKTDQLGKSVTLKVIEKQ